MNTMFFIVTTKLNMCYAQDGLNLKTIGHFQSWYLETKVTQKI